MEFGSSTYAPLLNRKVLDITSCKIIALSPLEYVTFAST